MLCLALALASLAAIVGAVPAPRESSGVATVVDDVALRRALQEQFTVRSLPCACEGVACSCCAAINIQKINFSQQGCLNLMYDASSLAVGMNVLANNRTLYETRISGRNPPPFCVPIPQFPAVMFCARFYDIHQDGGNIVACVKLEVIAFTINVVVINFDCIRVGVDGVSIVKPSEQLNIERPLGDPKPKPPTEVVIMLHPTSSTSVNVPTYDVAISLAETAAANEASSPTDTEVDDLDPIEEDLKKVTTTTTEAADDEDEDYDGEEQEAETVEEPVLVQTVGKVKRIVGDYKNYAVRMGEKREARV